MATLYIWAKKIHRILVLVVTTFILIMAGTGLLLKYPRLAVAGFPDLGLVRYLHNSLSPFFTITLTLMVLTGLFMYFYPVLQKRALEKKSNPSPPDKA